MIGFRRVKLLGWLIVCAWLVLSACNSHISNTVKPSIATLPATSAPPSTSTTSPIPLHYVTKTPTQNGQKTNIPSLVPTISQIAKALLFSVTSNVFGEVSESVWIINPQDVVPKTLLFDRGGSFEMPRWSNNGEWIAFEQYDLSNVEVSQIGVISQNGGDKHFVTSQKFYFPGFLNWSADDQWLSFVNRTRSGFLPYAVNVDSGAVINLAPNPAAHYSSAVLQPSSRDDLVVFAGLTVSSSDQRIEFWLISLNGSQENVRIQTEEWRGCSWITTPIWFSDGNSFIVQPVGGSPQDNCPPSLLKYDLKEKRWVPIAYPPSDDPSYLSLEFIDMSQDGQWLSWASIDKVLLFETTNWKLTREIDINGTQALIPFPWVESGAGESLYSLFNNEYSSTPYAILGLDPSNKYQDAVITKIDAESDWVRKNSEFVPIMWQP
jgi:dipeptidyl aminopeptidase/acylaminoacyl peptidase